MLLVATLWSAPAMALDPGAPVWRTGDAGQPGQLSVYNQWPLGGDYGLPLELGDFNGDGLLDVVVAPMARDIMKLEARNDAGEVYLYEGEGEIAGTIDRAAGGFNHPRVTLRGARNDDLFGVEMFVADFNGDGFDDLLIGAQNHDGPGDGLSGECLSTCDAPECGRDNAGAAYVLFGRPDLFPAPPEETERFYDVGDAAGTGAGGEELLVIYGAHPGARFGMWVEGGNLDGDAYDDMLIGADQFSEGDGPAMHRGQVVVIYGRESFPDVLDMSDPGIAGVSRVLGRDEEDHLGSSIHAADINGDGRDELIAAAGLARLSGSIGGASCFRADAFGGGSGPDNTSSRRFAGEVYVLFSRKDAPRLPAVTDLAAPVPGEMAEHLTTIYGYGRSAAAGEELESGDFNGDGRQDLVVGALGAASQDGAANAGKTYVLYWQPGLGENLVIDLDPGAGPQPVRISTLHGVHPRDILGDTLQVADFDHDGMDDLAVGVPHYDEEVDGATQFDLGLVAVLFGRESPWPALWTPLLDELPRGVRAAFIVGPDPNDLLSYSMAAGDYDGDGFADLFANAMWGDGGDNSLTDAGEGHLVSGYHFTATELEVDGVNPSGGRLDVPQVVTVRGSGFTTSADIAVAFGDAGIDAVEVISSHELAVELPAGLAEGSLTVSVTTRHGKAVKKNAYFASNERLFLRGDAAEDFTLNIADPVNVLEYLFSGGGNVVCRDAADSNDDGKVQISDALYTLNFLFSGGPAPDAPYPGIGVDPTGDELGCGEEK